MRSICKTVSTIGVFALLLGTAANAADMGRLPSAPPLLQNAPLLVDEFSSGWYLRGDVGYRWNELDDVTTKDQVFGGSNGDLGKSWMFGTGFGYKWEWFRADVTVDYGIADFSADSSVQTNDFKSKVDAFTGLVNVYGDLGTWFGLTPYIGVGAGVAYLQNDKFHVSSVGSDIEASNQWNFAWAYMAGVSYRFGDNYSIDLGYRHVNMGDLDFDKGASSNQLKLKSLSTDEVRIGFRYAID